MMLRQLYKGARSRLRFYRRHRPFELMWARVYFSQYGEDVFLNEYFKGKRDGFYVDVGAFHPVAYSNTFAFYRAGWRGINIEPNPQKLSLFERHRPRDILVNCAISEVEGSATFAVDEGFSGIVDDTYFHQARTAQKAQISVRTRPLWAVLNEHGASIEKPIDFLSIDCEGHDEVVLRSNDWGRHRPLLVLCEAFDRGTADRLRDYLKAQRYCQLATCGPTMVFEDQDERPQRPARYH